MTAFLMRLEFATLGWRWLPIVALAYLIGSIPFGVIVGRLVFKSDIRGAGSGNIGAANALRTYGRTGGAVVLVLDALKGYLPTLAAGYAFGYVVPAVVALCAVLGHCYSPWLRWNGGKGVATWLGALFAFSPLAGFGFIVIFLSAVLPTRFASFASLLATASSIPILWALGAVVHAPDRTPAYAAVLAACVIFWKHRENIARLRDGSERKIGLRRSRSAT